MTRFKASAEAEGNRRTSSTKSDRPTLLETDPMDQGRLKKQLANIRAAPRCGAKTRGSGACQCPAICGRSRCRLHGGRSTGAPKGSANGNYKDGTFSAEAIEERRWLRSIVRTYGKLEPS
jgi:glucans biosynthesis protein